MSPYISPRYVAERRRRACRTMAGIAVESLYALSLLGIGYLVCALVAGA